MTYYKNNIIVRKTVGQFNPLPQKKKNAISIKSLSNPVLQEWSGSHFSGTSSGVVVEFKQMKASGTNTLESGCRSVTM